MATDDDDGDDDDYYYYYYYCITPLAGVETTVKLQLQTLKLNLNLKP